MFYELLKDGSIGRSTPNEKVAKHLGLTLQTDKEIVYGYDGKQYFKGQEPTPPEPGYIEKRLADYPPFGEQLDMIYHDMDNWRSVIKSIKEKYPKE